MGGMVIKEVEMCVGLVKLGVEFVTVFAHAVKTVIHRSLDAEEDDAANPNPNPINRNTLNYNYQVPFPYPGILP